MANRDDPKNIQKEGALQEGVHSNKSNESIEHLLKEINYVLSRNKTETFLRKALTRILILEELQ